MPLRMPPAGGPLAPQPTAPTGRLRMPPIQASTNPGPLDTSAASGDGGDTSGFPWGGALAGGALLGGAALLSRNPNTPSFLKKGLEYANAARQQLMLSGYAPLKSLLGNVGAAGAEAAETRSLTPLKELFSMDTVRDATRAYKAGANVAPDAAAGVSLPGPMPGRIMGALDEATQNALKRSGMTPEAAQRAVFQTPLGVNYGPLGEKFAENPVADYLFPFRRTPLNQFAEGLDVLKKGAAGTNTGVLAGYTAAGAAHGAMTKDEQYPVTVPFGVAASAKYGMPYGLGAIAGRLLAGGHGAGNIPSNVLPVSEYGLSQSIEDPLGPFKDPAALRVLRSIVK